MLHPQKHTLAQNKSTRFLLCNYLFTPNFAPRPLDGCQRRATWWNKAACLVHPPLLLLWLRLTSSAVWLYVCHFLLQARQRPPAPAGRVRKHVLLMRRGANEEKNDAGAVHPRHRHHIVGTYRMHLLFASVDGGGEESCVVATCPFMLMLLSL